MMHVYYDREGETDSEVWLSHGVVELSHDACLLRQSGRNR